MWPKILALASLTTLRPGVDCCWVFAPVTLFRDQRIHEILLVPETLVMTGLNLARVLTAALLRFSENLKYVSLISQWSLMLSLMADLAASIEIFLSKRAHSACGIDICKFVAENIFVAGDVQQFQLSAQAFNLLSDCICLLVAALYSKQKGEGVSAESDSLLGMIGYPFDTQNESSLFFTIRTC